MRTLLVTLGLTVLLGGCGDPSGPEPDEPLSLRIAGSSYTMTAGDGRSLYVTIPFTYTNRTGGPVQVPCGDVAYSLERKTARGWSYVWSRASSLSCLVRPFVIEPGGIYGGVHIVSAAVTGDDDVPMAGINGSYRFRWSNLRRYDPAAQAATTPVATVSNEFRLEAP